MNPLWQRAVLLYQQQRWQMAENACRELLVENPDDPNAHWLLALCLEKREAWEDATVAARQSISLAPEESHGYYVLALVMLGRQRWHEAGHAVGEALRLNPEDADYWSLLAQVFFRQERWNDALQAAERGLSHDPEHDMCLNLKAMSLNKLGRGSMASETLEAALAREPENSLTHANVGWTRLQSGRHREAVESFREALRLDPESELARQGMLEAIKARNPVYRLMLRYALWMARLPSQTRWVVIVVAFFGFRGVSRIGRTFPALAPYTGVIVTLYLVFVVATWLIEPLFNLMMRLHPDGKHVLSRAQITQANWVGGLVAGALGGLTLYFAAGYLTGQQLALVCGLLIPAVLGTLECDSGTPRWAMLAVTFGLLAIGTVNVALIGIAEFSPGLVREWMVGAARVSGMLFPLAAIGSQFAAMHFSSQTVQR